MLGSSGQPEILIDAKVIAADRPPAPCWHTGETRLPAVSNFYAPELMVSLGIAERGGTVRISFLHYNTVEEVDHCADALESIAKQSHRTGRLRRLAMDLGLAGSAILITGASGGIGQATARTFAAEGARVAVHYRTNRTAAERLADEVGEIPLRTDLTQERETDALIPAARDALGGLDACVANAGVRAGEEIPLWQMPLERWWASIEGNLTATFLTSRAYLRHVAETGAGSLVLVASTAAICGEAGNADYAAVKSAITYGLALSLKNGIAQTSPHGRVKVVAPGWTATPMTADCLDGDAVALATATMPLHKIAEPDDVAAAIAWVASPVAAGHITGQVITVAGGMEGRLLNDPRRGRLPNAIGFVGGDE
jgi:3-oxoacyl-[acyl-carrier protein] reductase